MENEIRLFDLYSRKIKMRVAKQRIGIKNGDRVTKCYVVPPLGGKRILSSRSTGSFLFCAVVDFFELKIELYHTDFFFVKMASISSLLCQYP